MSASNVTDTTEPEVALAVFAGTKAICPACDKPGFHYLDERGFLIQHPGRYFFCRVTSLTDAQLVALFEASAAELEALAGAPAPQ